jgi:hypothetical protein
LLGNATRNCTWFLGFKRIFIGQSLLHLQVQLMPFRRFLSYRCSRWSVFCSSRIRTLLFSCRIPTLMYRKAASNNSFFGYCQPLHSNGCFPIPRRCSGNAVRCLGNKSWSPNRFRLSGGKPQYHDEFKLNKTRMRRLRTLCSYVFYEHKLSNLVIKAHICVV